MPKSLALFDRHSLGPAVPEGNLFPIAVLYLMGAIGCYAPIGQNVSLVERATAARVQSEDRGFVMKTMTLTGKSSLSMLLCLAGLLSFAAPKVRADEEKDPPT